MPALALSSQTRAIVGSIAPDSARRRTFLPDSSSPLDPVDLTTSPETKTAKRPASSLVPAYLSPRKSKPRSDGSEESLPTPPPTSSVQGAEVDDGIEELSDSEFTPAELERSARKGELRTRLELTAARSRNIPSSSNLPSSASERSPLPRQPSRSRTPRQPSPMKANAGSKSRSASPVKAVRQPTLDDLFTTQQEKQNETPKVAPATSKRRRVAASSDDDDNAPLRRSRGRITTAARVPDSDDEAPLSARRKGKAREIVPASDDEPIARDTIDLMSSDPIDPIDAPDIPEPSDPDLALDDDYDDAAFPWDLIPDEPLIAPAPEPTQRKRPRQSIFDVPDFANEPSSQVPQSRSPTPEPAAAATGKGKGKLPAIKFGDFRLLNELDGDVRAFYEQHWRRGAGDEGEEWHEADRLAFTAAAPKRKVTRAPARRGGGWWKRARGRGRGR